MHLSLTKTENPAAKKFIICVSIDNYFLKLQDLTDSAIPFPGDFVIAFTSNKKCFGLLDFT